MAGATALVSARATGVFTEGTNGSGTPHARPGRARRAAGGR